MKYLREHFYASEVGKKKKKQFLNMDKQPLTIKEKGILDLC